MIKIIQRKSDNKYLQSLEKELWSDNITDAYEMTLIEMENMRDDIYSKYSSDDLKEIVNFSKMKPLTKEEKKEVIDFFKKKIII